MAEYIDRTVLLNHLKGCKGQPPEMCYSFAVITAIEAFVKNQPAAGVVEVVRCKDCKFCDDAYCNDGRKLKDLYYCNWFGSVVEKNDFCSYGAKMDLEESK